MSQEWDDFSRSLADGLVPRRESLRRLAGLMAAALAVPLSMATARAGGPRTRRGDPCVTFCRCGTKRQQDACLRACRACNSDPARLCGSCRGGFACKNLGNDVGNCGACGNACQPGALETSACVSGACTYTCVAGAVRCDGRCTLLGSDADNCGSCGTVCDDAGPNETAACVNGSCEYTCIEGAVICDGACTMLATDPNHCGACGNVCGEETPYCSDGACNNCTYGIACGGICTDVWWDSRNCGACGVICPDQFSCVWGVCEGYYGDGYGAY